MSNKNFELIKEYYDSIVTYFGLITLIFNRIYYVSRDGRVDLIFPVDSALTTAIPIVLTYVLLHLTMRIFSNVFNWVISYLLIHKNMIINNQETGKLQSMLRGKSVPLVGTLELIIGFALSTTTIPGSLSIKSEKFNADPLNPCADWDVGCQELLLFKFRFQWLQGASDVMVNGISKQLSMHWGDLVDGERVMMVATTDNNANTIYELVQTKLENIPSFALSTKCNTPNTSKPEYKIQGYTGFSDLVNVSKPIPLFDLIQTMQANSGLEGRWIGEIIKLEQDNLNETTRINLNFIQILPINSSCDGNIEKAGNLQICRPTKGLQISCLMNTHAEYVEYITAGCDNCLTRGFNKERVNYTIPKPVIDGFIFNFLASYGGHIMIPQCKDTVNFGGCLAPDTNNVDLVKDKFIELLRGITASGVIARRILLSDKGKEMPVQLLIKGETGVKLVIGKGYWITILILNILCVLGVASWQFIKRKELNKNHQISIEWLIFYAKDTENGISNDDGLIRYTTEDQNGETNSDILDNDQEMSVVTNGDILDNDQEMNVVTNGDILDNDQEINVVTDGGSTDNDHISLIVGN